MECVPAADNLRIFGQVSRFDDVTADMIRAAGEARKKVWWKIEMWGLVTDDTAMADLLIDCLLRHDGEVTAHEFALEWRNADKLIADPAGGPDINRMHYFHWLEQITFLRNKLLTINKRELGQGEIQATNALMCSAPIGLVHAGDPLAAEQAAVDITSVHQHGASRDAAGAYCAALAHCFLPEATVESIIATALKHLRDERLVFEVNTILEVAKRCSTCREFIDRYWQEIVGTLVPRQDWQHHGTGSLTTWNNSEVLGVALGMFRISDGGADGLEMLRSCALNGRDADTTCRVAGGLLGAWRGLAAIPKEWIDFVLPRNQWLHLERKSAELADLVIRRLHRRQNACAAVLANG
jgi:ADP-ribosylglycohydrolase